MPAALPYPEPRVALPTYGRALVDTLPPSLLEAPIVLTQPQPWPLLAPHLPDRSQVHMVTTMEHARVKAVTEAFEPASAVIGFGGGAALDHAKYVAWQRNLPLVLIPSILSVDAAYTKAIGVREGSRVRYVGEVFPEHLLVDYGLLQSAPPLLNRAGIGDILSIFTALWDWKEAGERLGEPYDPAIAAASQELLDRLFDGAEALAAVSEEGLHLLSELYVGEVRLCEMVGNSRPEEGSEHYVAYCLESLSGRSYVHGQLIGLGVLVAGRYQGQEIGPVADFLQRLQLDCRLNAVGTSRGELLRTLLEMGRYVKQEEQLLPGVFHFREGIGVEEAQGLLTELAPFIE